LIVVEDLYITLIFVEAFEKEFYMVEILFCFFKMSAVGKIAFNLHF